MEKVVVVDANLIIRFFQRDVESLYLKAEEIFTQGQNGEVNIYIDEIIVAEVIWVSQSFYKLSRKKIAESLRELLYQDWVVNPRKEWIIEALELFNQTNLSFADCWISVVGKKLSAKLETFD
ncbi:MAG: PIN domain-containing protein [Patescibacteria group bacterium]